MKTVVVAGLCWALLLTCHARSLRRKRQVGSDTGIVDVPDIAGGTPPPTAVPITAPTPLPTTPNPSRGLFFGNTGINFPNLFGFGGTGGFPGGPGGFPGGNVGFPGGVGGGFPGGDFGGNVGGGGGGIGGFPLPTPRPPLNGGGLFGGGFPQIGNGFPPNNGGGNPAGGNPFPDFGFGNNNTLNFPSVPPFDGQQGGSPFTNFPRFTTRPPPTFPTVRPGTTASPAFSYSVCTPPVFSPLGDQVANTTIPPNVQALITQELSNNLQLRALLEFASNVSGAPSIFGNSDLGNSDVSCPSSAYRATVFKRNGGNCWILQEQQPFFYATCKCNECLAPTGFRQFPGSACEPFLLPTAVFAYCEGGFSFTPRITQERIALPVTCRCRHAASSATLSPVTGSEGQITPAVTAAPSSNGNDPVIAISS